MTLIGYVEMKKQDGKVLFVTEVGKEPVVGSSCDKVFVYGDIAKKINPSHVGKDINVAYQCGYNGRAYVSDVNIK